MSDWISIKDRLPKPHDYVLWARRSGHKSCFRAVVEGFYEPWPNGMQFWRETKTPSIPLSLQDVTHWQPMPDAPDIDRCENCDSVDDLGVIDGDDVLLCKKCRDSTRM